jgi:hypothetical protein
VWRSSLGAAFSPDAHFPLFSGIFYLLINRILFFTFIKRLIEVGTAQARAGAAAVVI